MPKKYLIASLILGVLVVGFIFLSQNSGTPPNLPPVAPPLNSNPAVITTPPSGAAPVPVQTSAESFIISYNANGFNPKILTVPKGAMITFKNLSVSDFWPASGVHPTHAGYPTTGGCVGSTFDACGPIPPGGSWSFKFDILGVWGYHDHLNTSLSGKVFVQ